MSLDWAVAFEDFRAMARARLPRILFDYIDGGSYGEVTIRRNAEELDRVILPQRVMRDMREVSTATRLLGARHAGGARPGRLRGHVRAAGRGAGGARGTSGGLPFTLSTVGICSAEEVAREAGVAP